METHTHTLTHTKRAARCSFVIVPLVIVIVIVFVAVVVVNVVSCQSRTTEKNQTTRGRRLSREAKCVHCPKGAYVAYTQCVTADCLNCITRQEGNGTRLSDTAAHTHTTCEH